MRVVGSGSRITDTRNKLYFFYKCSLVLTVCLLIIPFGDTTEFFDSDGLLCRNSLLVFSLIQQLFLFSTDQCVHNFQFVLVLVIVGKVPFGLIYYNNNQWCSVVYRVLDQGRLF